MFKNDIQNQCKFLGEKKKERKKKREELKFHFVFICGCGMSQLDGDVPSWSTNWM